MSLSNQPVASSSSSSYTSSQWEIDLVEGHMPSVDRELLILAKLLEQYGLLFKVIGMFIAGWQSSCKSTVIERLISYLTGRPITGLCPTGGDTVTKTLVQYSVDNRNEADSITFPNGGFFPVDAGEVAATLKAHWASPMYSEPTMAVEHRVAVSLSTKLPQPAPVKITDVHGLRDERKADAYYDDLFKLAGGSHKTFCMLACSVFPKPPSGGSSAPVVTTAGDTAESVDIVTPTLSGLLAGLQNPTQIATFVNKWRVFDTLVLVMTSLDHCVTPRQRQAVAVKVTKFVNDLKPCALHRGLNIRVALTQAFERTSPSDGRRLLSDPLEEHNIVKGDWGDLFPGISPLFGIVDLGDFLRDQVMTVIRNNRETYTLLEDKLVEEEASIKEMLKYTPDMEETWKAASEKLRIDAIREDHADRLRSQIRASIRKLIADSYHKRRQAILADIAGLRRPQPEQAPTRSTDGSARGERRPVPLGLWKDTSKWLNYLQGWRTQILKDCTLGVREICGTLLNSITGPFTTYMGDNFSAFEQEQYRGYSECTSKLLFEAETNIGGLLGGAAITPSEDNSPLFDRNAWNVPPALFGPLNTSFTGDCDNMQEVYGAFARDLAASLEDSIEDLTRVIVTHRFRMLQDFVEAMKGLPSLVVRKKLTHDEVYGLQKESRKLNTRRHFVMALRAKYVASEATTNPSVNNAQTPTVQHGQNGSAGVLPSANNAQPPTGQNGAAGVLPPNPDEGNTEDDSGRNSSDTSKKRKDSDRDDTDADDPQNRRPFLTPKRTLLIAGMAVGAVSICMAPTVISTQSPGAAFVSKITAAASAAIGVFGTFL